MEYLFKKHFMKNFFNYIVNNFGFADITDFVDSMVHVKFLFLTVPSSFVLFTFLEEWLGVTSAIFIAFIVMAILELVTGLWRARAKRQKWSSRKFSRFGLKILVWLSLIMVANSFQISYEDLKGVQNYIIYQLFHWLHGVLVVYVAFEYLISILENLSSITGKSNNKLVEFLKKKFDQFLGAADEFTTPDVEKDENARNGDELDEDEPQPLEQ